MMEEGKGRKEGMWGIGAVAGWWVTYVAKRKKVWEKEPVCGIYYEKERWQRWRGLSGVKHAGI